MDMIGMGKILKWNMDLFFVVWKLFDLSFVLRLTYKRDELLFIFN